MDLFKKNIFSVQSPTFSKLANPLVEEISSTIKKYYPNLLVKEIYQIGAFELNSNNWKIVTDNETFLLKRADISKFESLSEEATWTSQLTSEGFPSLRFLKNKENDIISKDDKHIYCITFFETGLYFGSSTEEWSDLIINLKKLYDYSKNDTSNVSSLRSSRIFFTEEENQLIYKLKSVDSIKEITKIQIDQVISEYEKTKQIFLTEKHNYHTSIFHVDIHPHNLIFNNNKLLLLTDFESFQVTTTEVSLGFGLYKCLRQLLAINENQTEKEIETLINRLNDQFVSLFPEQKLKKLLHLGKIDVVKRLLYILKELLEKGESKWLFIFQTQLTSLEEINEMEKFLS